MFKKGEGIDEVRLWLEEELGPAGSDLPGGKIEMGPPANTAMTFSGKKFFSVRSQLLMYKNTRNIAQTTLIS